MKVLLAGAFGNLGFEILKQLVEKKYEVIAADLKEKENNGLEGKYTFKAIDATNPETLKGICDGVDTVITTMGLTTSSTRFTAYDIDYQGNLNLYNEAKKANVRKFNYISVISCDEPGAEKVPMLHAKYMLEQEIKKGDMSYVIYRPTGYFYDIAKVFMPMIEKGKVTLLGNKAVHCNVVDTPDFAAFIVEHMCDNGKLYNVGGKETWSYEELARMFFAAAGKEPNISRAPVWLFDVLAWVNKQKKNGKEAIIRFSKWTLTEEMVGDTIVGDASFAEYIKKCYKK